MQSNIDVIEYENYEMLVKKYDQFRLQNLMALGSSSNNSNSTLIQTSDTCKKTITIVFWDIRGFSKLTKLFYLMDMRIYHTRIFRRIL